MVALEVAEVEVETPPAHSHRQKVATAGPEVIPEAAALVEAAEPDSAPAVRAQAVRAVPALLASYGCSGSRENAYS